MTDYFKSADYQVYPQTGTVLYQGEKIKIRPRTFELLIMLLEAEGEIVSKEQLLNKIWDDVLVDDQVIFQSIKELRKTFQALEVIKNYPRKGYAWILPIERKSDNDSIVSTKNLVQKYWILTSATLLILLIAIFWINNTNNSSNAPTGSIIILPVKNDISDISHRWIRYGLMDQLIQRLSPSNSYGVLQTEDVLDIMKRAQIQSSEYSRSDIERIFQVSGAALVVEMRLTGMSRNYQLLYNLHQRDDIEKGVVVEEQIDDVVNKLSFVLNKRLGQSDSSLTEISAEISAETRTEKYNSEFANQLLATALELIQADDLTAAIKFLNTTIVAEPQNITAKLLLAETLVNLGDYEQAVSLLEGVILQVNKEDNKNLSRLRFWLSIAKIQKGEVNSALELLALAKKDSELVKDWLYLGYIAEITGKAQQINKNYVEAKKQYQLAIDYHQVIQCPYGHVQGLLNLANLATQEADFELARNQTLAAIDIIDQRDLPFLKELAQSSLDKIDSQLALKND